MENISIDSSFNSLFKKPNYNTKIELNSFGKYICICQKCNIIPLIKLKDLETIFVKCNCIKNIEEKKIFDVWSNYLIDEEGDEYIIKYVKCIEHESCENNIFRYYCNNCEKNLCEICIREHKCEKEYRLDLRIYDSEIEEKYQYLENILQKVFNPKNNDENKSQDFSMENLDQIIAIISSVFNHYKKYPHNTIKSNIYNIYEFINRMEPEEKNENEIDDDIEIHNSYEYKQACKQKKEKQIIKIKINKQELDINIFKDKIKNLNNIKILDIHNNFIKDISPLANVELDNLEELHLKINHLGDNQIVHIKNMKFKNLTLLDLGTNLFSSYEIITIVKLFPNLEKFDLDSNLLKDNIDCLKKEILELNSIKELTLSNGIFSSENIDTIFSYLKFENLIKLDLSSNNLNSLSFIENINYGNEPNILEELILNCNDISLKDKDKQIFKNKFKKLKKLELKENCLTNDIKELNILPFIIYAFDNNINNDKPFIFDENNQKNFDANYNKIDQEIKTQFGLS